MNIGLDSRVTSFLESGRTMAQGGQAAAAVAGSGASPGNIHSRGSVRRFNAAPFADSILLFIRRVLIESRTQPEF